MTLSISFYDNIKYHRDDFIGRDKDFFGNGVVNTTDFPITYPSPANMTLQLGAGTAWVDGYRIHNDSGLVTVTVPAADTTNPRIDIIQIGHDDVNSTYSLQVKKGVAATSPVEPGADPNYIKLYAISVAANATSITSSNVTDRRSLVPLNVSGTQISLGGAALASDVGDKTLLVTTNKSDLVHAINEVDNQVNAPTPVSVTLNHGQNIINAVANALLSMGFTGRTLINLLGRDGNCEDVSKWSTYQATIALDSSNKVYGSNGIKATIGTGYTSGSTYRAATFYANKYYVVLAELKNGNAGTVSISINAGSTGVASVTDTSKFNVVYLKATYASDVTTNVNFNVSGTAGQYGYVDGFRVFEITQAEYNALGTTLTDINAIADKYPYVDDVKHYTNPYIIGYVKNLLPPFSQWSDNTASHGIITGSYSYSLTSTAMDQYISYDVKVLPNTSYILSATHNGWLGVYDVTNGSWIQQQITTSSVTFNTGTANTIRISFRNTTTTGTFTFTDPQLELGSTATTFVPRNDDNLFLQTSLCASLDGTVQDTAYQKDGQWYKLSRFGNLVLDGTLAWGFGADYSGYKQVNIVLPNSIPDNLDRTAAKYDGKILGNKTTGTGTGSADNTVIDGSNNFIISVADTDSGWGETYTPTAQEIQAYFYGWAMSATNTTPSPYTGTGTKYWYKVGTSPTTNGYYTTACPTVLVDNVYTPYKLTYQLATSQEVAITAEGSLNVNEGLNQIELGEAVIVREAVTPKLSDGGNVYTINYNLSGYSTALTKRLSKFITIYKNGSIDNEWQIIVNPSSYGSYMAQIPNANFDTTAAYSVTYIAQPYQLACSALPQNGTYDANLKTAVDNTIQRVTDLETEVTALQITKANRQQGQWIAPTLLNGWVNFSTSTGGQSIAGYMKNEFNDVRLKGNLKSGTATSGTVLFYLPVGYRPKEMWYFYIYSWTGSAFASGGIIVNPDGSVVITGSPSNFQIALDGITFRAEQ